MQAFSRARRTRRGLLHFSLCALALLAVGGAQAAPLPAGNAKEVLVLGDSISAEYGLARGSGWVALLSQKLATDKPGWTVRNAAISGDTTAGGVARLPALLAQEHPKVVILELGGNDALRGLPLADSRKNLDQMATLASAAGARVLIAGIQVPPNYGREYTEQFSQMFAEVATAHHAALVPFILQGIAGRPDEDDWFQADHIHPLAKAHPIILGNVWPVLEPLLK